jgi:hypothetical protein
VAAGAVIVLLLTGIFFTRKVGTAEEPQSIAMQPTANGVADADDQQFLDTVAQLSPDVRDSYRQGLHDVNDYIKDIEQSVRDNPDDQNARQFLMQAYQQKSMLYEMATRSHE